MEITRLAGLGDGVTHLEGQTVFVPFTLAGERWRVRVESSAKGALTAEGVECLQASPDRRQPPCPSFGLCGGCKLQHMNEAAYHAFKVRIAEDAARILGAEAMVQPLFKVAEHTRRRAQWKAQMAEGRLRLGFYAAKSHLLVDTSHCVVVTRQMRGFIAALEQFWAETRKLPLLISVHVTDLAHGLDVVVEAKTMPTPAQKEALATWLHGQRVVRALWRAGESEMFVVAGQPEISFHGVSAPLSEGAFLQATHESQEFMIEQVIQGVGGAASVVDLYAGSGTYALPLAQAGKRVYAFEGWHAAAEALHNALRPLPWRGLVEVTQRDLVKSPVPAHVLSMADAVVINPPRNGALPQAKEIAASDVARVVMVSCNPATFIRDAKAMCDAGFRLVSLTPVDQFLYSHHLEFIGIFTR